MIPPKLQDHLDTLALLPDRHDRIEALIALADEYQARSMPDVPRDLQHRVPACESEVYMRAVPEGQSLKFEFAVDNPQGMSAMALARILEDSLSGVALDQVAQVSDEIVYEIFGRELSMGKSAGLMGMVQMVRGEAKRGLGV
ncbi:MAG TPA: SufE family protein [Fimbriimonas sp.]|nr:SufE family protein [Fimbriimonas sp.]